jgi:hypothetical protein
MIGLLVKRAWKETYIYPSLCLEGLRKTSIRMVSQGMQDICNMNQHCAANLAMMFGRRKNYGGETTSQTVKVQEGDGKMK